QSAERPASAYGSRRLRRRLGLHSGTRRRAVRPRRAIRARGRMIERGDRRIAALRQAEDDGVAATFAGVILGELRPQTRGFDADDRIETRVIARVAVEHLDADNVFLETLAFAGERLLDDELQEPAHAPRVREHGAREQPVELAANVVSTR